MKPNYRVGPNRGITDINNSRKDYPSTIYLDPSAGGYSNTSANAFTSPTNIKGCIVDPSFNSFVGVGDPNFVGISYLSYGETITEVQRDPIILEGLYFSDYNGILNFKIQTRKAEPLHIIFNRCYFTQVAALLNIFYDIKDAVIEFRHCAFKIYEPYHFYFFRTVTNTSTCTINISRCILDVVHLEHHTYLNNVREDRVVYELFQQRDHVKIPTVGYGPEYGTDMLSNNSPKFSGYILKNGEPVIRQILFHNRYGKTWAPIYSDSNGYYEWDLWDNIDINEIFFMLIVGEGDEESLVIEDLKPLEHYYVEL